MDPLDFSPLQAAITHAIDQLKGRITEARKGPRDVAAIEGLQVSLVKDSKETIKLGELAQVVSRGRMVAVMVGHSEVRSIFRLFGFLSAKERGKCFPITSSIVAF